MATSYMSIHHMLLEVIATVDRDLKLIKGYCMFTCIALETRSWPGFRFVGQTSLKLHVPRLSKRYIELDNPNLTSLSINSQCQFSTWSDRLRASILQRLLSNCLLYDWLHPSSDLLPTPHPMKPSPCIMNQKSRRLPQTCSFATTITKSRQPLQTSSTMTESNTTPTAAAASRKYCLKMKRL